jgi:hypothetical protein
VGGESLFCIEFSRLARGAGGAGERPPMAEFQQCPADRASATTRAVKLNSRKNRHLRASAMLAPVLQIKR